jgi:putative oxidoreductase
MLSTIFRPPSQTVRASAGLLVLRLFCGYAFMTHGWGKIQKPFSWMGPDATIPGFFQALAALSEFGGGLAWILGLLTPLASFGLACTMAVAAYTHLVVMKQGLVATGPGGSAEPAATYFCVAMALMLAGPGRFSADAFVFREKKA